MSKRKKHFQRLSITWNKKNWKKLIKDIRKAEAEAVTAEVEVVAAKVRIKADMPRRILVRKMIRKLKIKAALKSQVKWNKIVSDKKIMTIL